MLYMIVVAVALRCIVILLKINDSYWILSRRATLLTLFDRGQGGKNLANAKARATAEFQSPQTLCRYFHFIKPSDSTMYVPTCTRDA